MTVKKKIKLRKLLFLLILISVLRFPAEAAGLQVVTSYPYQREIVRTIGAERVRVEALARGQWDPHVVVPRPSLIAMVRRAELLVINGAQLEIGWMPPLLQQANNPRVMPGRKGFLDFSELVELIQKPDSVSRAQGDIHPAGNPHFYLDPTVIPKLAAALSEKLCELDPAGQTEYQNNLQVFNDTWQKNLERWSELMAPLAGRKVIQYHRNMDYFLLNYSIDTLATIEPLPGIPPTTRQVMALIDMLENEGVFCIIHDVYHSEKSSRFLSERSGIPLVILPHDVEALAEADTLTALFDTLVNRLVRK